MTGPVLPPGTLIPQVADAALKAEDAVLTAPPGTEPVWAKPAVAVASYVVFAGMVAFAYITKNDRMLDMLGGTAIAMVSMAGNYYLGSSAGSQRKTDLLAAAPPIIVK